MAGECQYAVPELGDEGGLDLILRVAPLDQAGK
jgi:hypothetical protein